MTGGAGKMFDALRAALGRTPARETRLWHRLRLAYKARLARAELERVAASPEFRRKRRLLIINHHFQGELKALEAARAGFPDVALLALPPEPFFTPLVYLFPQEIRCAREPYDAPRFAPLRKEARRLSRTIYDQIQAVYPFEAVVTPSDSFYWLREFIMVCREGGIPVFVADKEGTISPRSFESEPLRISECFPPISDQYLVWSQRQSDFWKKAGVPGERIKVTGSARSDLFVSMRRKPPENVVFFDFDSDAYINVLDWSRLAWTGERNWHYLRAAFRNAAARVAAEFPRIEVILKCHPQQLSYDSHGSRLASVRNVRIIRGAEVSELLQRSYAVAGFQTTALMEAALARIPVFYAAWGGLFEAVSKEILPFHEPGYGMTLCRSEDAIVDNVRRAIKAGGSLPPPDAAKLALFFHNPDGNCAKRLIQAALDLSSRRPARC